MPVQWYTLRPLFIRLVAGRLQGDQHADLAETLTQRVVDIGNHHTGVNRQ